MPEHSFTLFHTVALFAAYSFLGWLIEVVYRSISQRKFVNAGFLYGPFIPIYGMGAFCILALDFLLRDWPFIARTVFFGVALTLLEYIIGYLTEKIFDLRLWDYSKTRFNLHGRVSLPFSLGWMALAVIFLVFIHPAVSGYLFKYDYSQMRFFAVAFLVYFLTDFIFSVVSLEQFRRKIAYLYAEYFNLANIEVEKIFDSLRRLRSAFPDLNLYINDKIESKIKGGIGNFLKSVQDRVFLEIDGRKPFEEEFYESVADIYAHEEFERLKDYFHHNSSIYEHVREVAYLSYRLCKYLKLDYRSAARGALLHDYFFYDWRNHDEPHLHRNKNHGIEHPKIALANAKKSFALNKVEEDIIRKHMWPLTPVPPRYKEAFIVSFVDKYLASREFLDEFKKRINKKLPKKIKPRRKQRRRKSNAQPTH
ncbi:MAG TPA: HD domain-containing protein [Smithellaceae bacterium]|nr:HD domain-containing protein [Smithellaceae bacterium]HRS88489.1 HD domain-containing protein [Smithellaceae bacterium]HRV25545.1 HD domain-containing protein [Smithellaceae bacterium]